MTARCAKTRILPVLFLLPFPFFLILSQLPSFTLSISKHASFSQRAETVQEDGRSWLNYLIKVQNGTVETKRLGCRELDAGAQSCMFEGIACINATSYAARPIVYLIDETKQSGSNVASDDWCHYRAQSSDPRYYSSRHWPIMNDTIAPQRSCLNAIYANRGVLGGWKGVKWTPEIWLVDLDYRDNNHNNHLVKDIIWMLDARLWQRAMDLRKGPGEKEVRELFGGERWVYLPQNKKEFEHQTGRDVNRLMYALILELDAMRLYRNYSGEEMKKAPRNTRYAERLLKAYPQLKERLLFHGNLVRDKDTKLVCTPRLAVGSKIGNGGHERVCRSIRTRAWELYGIDPGEKKRLGQVWFFQPPKRVLIVQRHVTRRIANLEELVKGLKKDVKAEIEVVSTERIQSAEEWVRVFSRAGVVVTSHGSQSMGMMFMPRHSALIEIMPVGYTDYAFNLLSESCKIWYYETQSLFNEEKEWQYYEEECGNKEPHMFNPCTAVKSVDVVANVPKIVQTTRLAMERLGYPMGEWRDFVEHG